MPQQVRHLRDSEALAKYKLCAQEAKRGKTMARRYRTNPNKEFARNGITDWKTDFILIESGTWRSVEEIIKRYQSDDELRTHADDWVSKGPA
jgi:hypothetical protein